MKKRLIALIMAVVLCFSLSACAGGNKDNTVKNDGASSDNNKEGTEQGTEKEQEKEQITLEFWTLSLQPTFNDYINGVIADFEAQYDNIKVKWVDLPYDSMQSKLVAQIGGNNAPDVVNTWTTLTLGMAGKGALVNLREEATEEQLSIYQDNICKSNEMNGGLYGFPWYVTPSITTYNKELLAQAGIAAPPKDYDEFFSVAKQVKDNTGAYLFVPNCMSQTLYFNGIPLLNEDKTKAAFNTPEAAALLTKFADGVKDGYIPKTDWNNWDNMIKLFCTNKLVSISQGSQTVTRIKNESPTSFEKIDVAPPLLGSAGMAQGALQSLVIPKASKYHEEAILFANFLSNDANQLEFCKQAAIFPTTIEAAKDSYFTSDTETMEGKARNAAAQAAANSTDLGLGVEKESDIIQTIDQIYDAVILSGKSPEKVLADAEKKVNGFLAQ